MEEMANDVARYMYKHKISTATLAGHGLGKLRMNSSKKDRKKKWIFLDWIW